MTESAHTLLKRRSWDMPVRLHQPGGCRFVSHAEHAATPQPYSQFQLRMKMALLESWITPSYWKVGLHQLDENSPTHGCEAG